MTAFKSLSKQQIEKAVREKHGLSKDCIRLAKHGGYWWWEGAIVPETAQNNTCTTTLDGQTLHRWVADFEFRILNHCPPIAC